MNIQKPKEPYAAFAAAALTTVIQIAFLVMSVTFKQPVPDRLRFGTLAICLAAVFIVSRFGGLDDALPIEEIAQRNKWPANWRNLAKGNNP